MKFLEQNWTWLMMFLVPLWITAINISRNVLIIAVSIPTNGFLAKNRHHSGMPQNTLLAHDAPAWTVEKSMKILGICTKALLHRRSVIGIVLNGN
jgi:hypothetical protein